MPEQSSSHVTATAASDPSSIETARESAIRALGSSNRAWTPCDRHFWAISDWPSPLPRT